MEELKTMLYHIAAILDTKVQRNCIVTGNVTIWTEIRKSSHLEITDRLIIVSNANNKKKIKIGFYSPNLKEKIKAAIELIK